MGGIMESLAVYLERRMARILILGSSAVSRGC